VCLRAELSVGGSGESVSTRPEVAGDGAKRDQETLRVRCRFEALEDPFSLGVIASFRMRPDATLFVVSHLARDTQCAYPVRPTTCR
jgi:hypothetical protein